ncbi:Fic family protein [Streptomyces sp. GXMU-J15]|uniref:Fic family protein n=1 Tax=Streptomyces fuscus TaxID=3048495 RepID=A0ABT7J3E2_9ACTN|nr:Fic family protein [Streptomyces fuscus]MDL2079375.1 Fic family protein [Streptomyces fuscus]
MADHLRTWLALRDEIPWHRSRPVALPAPRPLRDGAAHDIRTFDHARDPARAARLLTALTRAREDAAARTPLSFHLLSSWQRLVLGTPEAPFRRHPAYAKDGRERYGISPDLPARLNTCLAEAEAEADSGSDSGSEPESDELPLAARATRAYLDVCFFHPFDDGNARSAFLTLTYVLARADVTLDQVGPIRRIQRRADDPEGALALADLIALLINRTRTTPTYHPHSADRPPTCPPPH